MNKNAHEKTSATSSFTNDVSFNNDVPVSCASNNHVTMHSSTKDMAKDMTSKHLSMMIRDCVKAVLFRRVKFYKKRIHGSYDFRTGTVMALVIQCCNVQQEKVTVKWWEQISKLIGTTVTDHRNNVVKTPVHKCFECKFENVTCSYFCFMHSEQSTLLEGVAEKIEHFKQNNGSDADMAYMLLAMRNNIVQYVNLIDIYAPCIVGSAKWNDVDNMNQHCRDNVILFQQIGCPKLSLEMPR
jgi:hypothetical protein